MTPEPTPSQELRKKLGLLISKHEAIPQVSYHHAGDTIDGSPIYEADDQKTAYKKWQKSFTDDLIEFIKQHELSRKQEWATSLEAEIRRHALTVFDVDDETLVPIEQVFKIIKEQSKE